MQPLYWFVLGVAIICNTLADILLRLGMERVGTLSWQAVKEWRVVVGVLMMASFFGLYSMSLSQVDVSLANPLTALNIVLGTLYASLRMGEKVSRRRWAGVLLVTLGAVLAGLTA